MSSQSGKAGAVISIGRLYCDVVFTGLDAMPRLGREAFAEAVDLKAGGGAYIAAAHFAALGRQSALLARIGTDAMSGGLMDELAASGVALDFLEHAPDAGPQLTVVLTQESERAFVSRRAGPARPKTLEAALAWSRACHVHIAEYATLNEIPDLVARAKAKGLSVSLDPSWDGTLIRDAGLLAACAGVDVFLPNVEEAVAITGHEGIDAAMDLLCAHFPIVAIKAGAEGARLGTAAGARVGRSAPKVTVRDTTGAGDAFNAGMIDAWLAGKSFEQCLGAGIARGSLSVQHVGGAGVPMTDRARALGA